MSLEFSNNMLAGVQWLFGQTIVSSQDGKFVIASKAQEQYAWIRLALKIGACMLFHRIVMPILLIPAVVGTMARFYSLRYPDVWQGLFSDKTSSVTLNKLSSGQNAVNSPLHEATSYQTTKEVFDPDAIPDQVDINNNPTSPTINTPPNNITNLNNSSSNQNAGNSSFHGATSPQIPQKGFDADAFLDDFEVELLDIMASPSGGNANNLDLLLDEEVLDLKKTEQQEKLKNTLALRKMLESFVERIPVIGDLTPYETQIRQLEGFFTEFLGISQYKAAEWLSEQTAKETYFYPFALMRNLGDHGTTPYLSSEDLEKCKLLFLKSQTRLKQLQLKIYLEECHLETVSKINKILIEELVFFRNLLKPASLTTSSQDNSVNQPLAASALQPHFLKVVYLFGKNPEIKLIFDRTLPEITDELRGLFMQAKSRICNLHEIEEVVCSFDPSWNTQDPFEGINLNTLFSQVLSSQALCQ